jgi:GntR family transcriptional regulator / MocR family aminotransferase
MMEPKKRRGPASPVVHLVMDPDSAVPMYRQVYEGLREAMLTGRLARGARLPSSRALAADLGVARNTVLQAFDQLRSEGYLHGRRGGGTRAREVIPDLLLTVPRAARTGKASSRPSRSTEASRSGSASRTAPGAARQVSLLSRRGQSLATTGATLIRAAGPHVPFELGVPAHDAFPRRLWGQLTGRLWRRGDVDLGELDPAGEASLRTAIAEYLATARGVRCTVDQVFVVNGAQQALHLVAQLLLDPGDRAWIEEPGYVGARVAFEAAGARLVPVPVDDDGLDVGAGARMAHDARLAYVTPSHQFPLGVVMSASRRLQLLAWARANGAWIIEDDYDSEFRYTGRPLPSMQGLEAEQSDGSPSRVLYVGTFSKTLVSGLRIGYMVVPDELIDAFRAARSTVDRHTPTIYQQVLADFIGEGHYFRHIRHVRNLCAERQAVLVDAAGTRLDGLLHIQADPAGLHLLGRLPPEIPDTEAHRAAMARGIRSWALSGFYLGEAPAQGAMVLGYGGFDARAIREGVGILAEVLGRMKGHGSTD